MTRAFVKAKIRLQKSLEAREIGQGSIEYLGVIVVAVLLVVALVTVFQGFGLKEKIQGQLDQIPT
jgi:hypothetical protein